MLRLVNLGICSALSKFESQILMYKQDTEFLFFLQNFFFVNKARILLLFTYVFYFMFQLNFASSVDNFIYEHIESDYLVCHESFCQRNDSLHYLYTNTKLKLCLHIIEFLPVYLFNDLISNIQIFGHFFKWHHENYFSHVK